MPTAHKQLSKSIFKHEKLQKPDSSGAASFRFTKFIRLSAVQSLGVRGTMGCRLQANRLGRAVHGCLSVMLAGGISQSEPGSQRTTTGSHGTSRSSGGEAEADWEGPTTCTLGM